jgi:hypothetical protein
MKSILSFVLLVSIFSSAWARPIQGPCRQEAVSVVVSLYSDNARFYDQMPLIRVFSSRDLGASIVHYVQVVEGGSSSLMTVELDKAHCRVQSFE